MFTKDKMPVPKKLIRRIKIMSKQTNTKKRSSQANVVKGRLDISRSGMGFVIVEGMDKDILVKPNDFNRAFHGDTVHVQFSAAGDKSRRVEGKITDVVERKQTAFAGTIEVSKAFAFFTNDSDKPVPDFFVPLDKLNGAV